MPYEERKLHWHLLTPDGTDHVGGEAGVMLLEELRWTRWLGQAARWLRLSPAVGGADWVAARLRPHLGRFVRNAPGPERYP